MRSNCKCWTVTESPRCRSQPMASWISSVALRKSSAETGVYSRRTLPSVFNKIWPSGWNMVRHTPSSATLTVIRLIAHGLFSVTVLRRLTTSFRDTELRSYAPAPGPLAAPAGRRRRFLSGHRQRLLLALFRNRDGGDADRLVTLRTRIVGPAWRSESALRSGWFRPTGRDRCRAVRSALGRA